MTQDNPKIGPNYEERVSNILNDQGLILPGVDIDFFVEDSKVNLENWLANKEAYYSSGGVWLEHEDDEDIIGKGNEEVWRIHFTPPYVVSEDIDGKTITSEVNIHEPKEDLKHSAILAGLVGLIEYISTVEAGYLPKPDIIYGVTNKTMAKFACRRLGFDFGKLMDDNSYLVVSDFDMLKSATKVFIKKFGTVVVNLGLNEIEASGIIDQ